MPNLLVSIAICTHNRAALLEDALRSFARIVEPVSGNDFEILVVDNNSSDATAGVVGRWAAQSPWPLRYTIERHQGLSHARNRAVREAAGEWIWFVDDDVYFMPGWMDGVRAGVGLFPDASVLAGSVVPAFDGPRPSWLPSAALAYYGLTAFGDEPRWLEPGELPVGANTAFRRSVFERVGPFRVDLGRVGKTLTSGEECEVVKRLRERGDKVAYVPHARVLHRVSEERATMAWLRRRAYRGGITYVLTDGVSRGASRTSLIRQAARRIRDVARGALTSGVSRDDQIDYAWKLGTARQYVVEALRAARSSDAA